MTTRWLLTCAVAVVVGGAFLMACGGSDSPQQGEGGARRIAYGDHRDAFGDLWLPDVGERTVPVVVLIHGGFWRDGYFLDLMEPLVPSLLARGFAVWNIEYRRVGAGGGHPETFDDVAAAMDELADLPDDLTDRLDLTRVGAVGHSAGGHLAVWAASREQIPTGSPGADPRVVPTVVVSQAGVLDLAGCAREGIGGSACLDLLGASPESDPELYALTSPTEMVPIPATVVAIHGTADGIVPTTQSTVYVDAARAAGGTASYVEIDGADHFAHLDPDSAAWSAALDALSVLETTG